MNKSSKKPLLYVILIFLLVIVVAGLGYIFFIFYNNYSNQTHLNNLKQDVTNSSTAPETQPISGISEIVELADNPIDFNKLKGINDEIYAWIYIPNTNIDYPILQSKSSDFFYIDHDVYKNYQFAGSIYSESLNLRDFTDRNTVLYGQNMSDGRMFANLHKNEDKKFFDSNKYIYVYLPNQKLTYEVVSAYVYDDRHLLNSFHLDDDKVFKDYLTYVANPRSVVCNVNKNVKLDLNSKLITLSTCLNSNDNGRYLVPGVLIKNEQTK